MSTYDTILVLLITFLINAAQTVLFLYFGPRWTKKQIINEAVETYIDDQTGEKTVRLSNEFQKILLGIVRSPVMGQAAEAVVESTATLAYQKFAGMIGGHTKGMNADRMRAVDPDGKVSALTSIMDKLGLGEWSRNEWVQKQVMQTVLDSYSNAPQQPNGGGTALSGLKA